MRSIIDYSEDHNYWFGYDANNRAFFELDLLLGEMHSLTNPLYSQLLGKILWKSISI